MISVIVCGSLVAVSVLGRAAYRRWRGGSVKSSVTTSITAADRSGVIRARVGERVCLRKHSVDDDMIIWSAQYRGTDVSGIIREGIAGFTEWEFVVSDEMFDLDDEDSASGGNGLLVVDWELMTNP